jgi:hypothetical protein
MNPTFTGANLILTRMNPIFLSEDTPESNEKMTLDLREVVLITHDSGEYKIVLRNDSIIHLERSQSRHGQRIRDAWVQYNEPRG